MQIFSRKATRAEAGARRHLFPSLMILAAAASTQTFAADAKSDADDVIVTAQRGSTKIGALNEKRKDTSVTAIMSAEEIAERPGANIVDVIEHLPGLSTFSDQGHGQAATGQANYLTIRGLASSYDVYTLNGVRVPTADPNSRALSLTLVAPYGLAEVKVDKTPGADSYGDAIGGSVDIRTPSAFDFSGALNRITVDGNVSELASSSGAKSTGGGGQFEIARRFGPSDQFGVYATAYYDQQYTVGESVEVNGYASANANGTGSPQATGVRWDYFPAKITREGGNIALDYRAQNQKLYFIGSYASYETTEDDVQHSIIGCVATCYSNGSTFSPLGLLQGSYFQEQDTQEHLITTKAGGETDLGALTLDYSLSYGYNELLYPNYVEGSLYGALDLTGSATFDVSSPSHVGITFNSPAAQAYAYNQNVDHFWKVQGQDEASKENMYSGQFNAKYDIKTGVLDSIKGGVDVDLASRGQFDHQFYGNNGDNYALVNAAGDTAPFYNPNGPSIANLAGRNLASFMDYNYGGPFKIYDRSVFTSFALPGRYQSHYAIDPTTGQQVGDPGAYTLDDYNRNTVTGDENIYAVYGQAVFKADKLTAIAGVRYEHTDESYTSWLNGQNLLNSNGTANPNGIQGSWTSSSSSYGNVLPSLLVTYRPDDNVVLRGAIRQSISRPAFGLIAQPGYTVYDPTSGLPTAYYEGNPDLKPTQALNYDASAEFYGQHGNIFEVAVYRKELRDFIYAATTDGGAPGQASNTIGLGTVSDPAYNKPENGGEASVQGIELNGRYHLADLPEYWNGLGVGANVTMQHSQANSGGRVTPLSQAPKIVYNLDLFYEKYKVRADLAYHYTGLMLNGVSSPGFDYYQQPTSSLDLSVSYPVYGVTITFNAKNMLDTTQFYKTIGESTQYLGTQQGGGNGSYLQTGRYYTLTASYKF